MKLYDLAISGNCYKIRLFLSLVDISYTKISVDVHAGENKATEFLSMNPNGLLPVLVDGETTIYDSAAILTYLAKSYADESWLPTDPVTMSTVIRWLAFEQSEGRFGLARARARLFKKPPPFALLGTLEESQTIGASALAILNQQLMQTEWLAGGSEPTIADIACYPYTAMSEEGGLSLGNYSAIQRWMKNIENLKGYIPLPGKD